MNVISPQIIKLQSVGFKVLWKESEAQHFKNDDKSGLYIHNVTRHGCDTISNLHAANWRNRLTENYLSQLYNKASGHAVSILPVFIQSVPQHWIHGTKKIIQMKTVTRPRYIFQTNQDCTHYCYIPGRFKPIWQNILNILKGEL
jgi:hypothetical protein